MIGLFMLPWLISGVLGEVDLPGDSAELLSKLEVFAANERLEAQVEVQEKRAFLRKLLQKHQARETKEGNLDQALALKAKIAELAGVEETEAESDENLPRDSVEALQKLSELSATKLTEVDRTIAEKAQAVSKILAKHCLLYTSDAADD